MCRVKSTYRYQSTTARSPVGFVKENAGPKRSAKRPPMVRVLPRSIPRRPGEPLTSCDIHRRSCRTEPRGQKCEQPRAGLPGCAYSGDGHPGRTHRGHPAEPFVHAQNAAFRRVEANVDKIYPESLDLCEPHCFESPSARKRRLDRETHPVAEVVLNSADDFATAGDRGVARIRRTQPARYRVRVNQIFASRKI